MNIGEGGGGRGFESFPNPCAYMMMMMPIGMAWHGVALVFRSRGSSRDGLSPSRQQHRVCVCRCMAAQPESLVASSGTWRSASSSLTSRPPHDDSLRTIPPANIKREGGGESLNGRTNRNLHATLAGVSGDSALRGTYIHTYTRSTGGGMQCTQARQGNMHLSTRCCSPATSSLSRPLRWTCNRNRNRPPDPCVRERHHVRFFFFSVDDDDDDDDDTPKLALSDRTDRHGRYTARWEGNLPRGFHARASVVWVACVCLCNYVSCVGCCGRGGYCRSGFGSVAWNGGVLRPCVLSRGAATHGKERRGVVVVVYGIRFFFIFPASVVWFPSVCLRLRLCGCLPSRIQRAVLCFGYAVSFPVVVRSLLLRSGEFLAS